MWLASDIEWVEAKIDAGEELPTVVEVRHKVKQTQAERLAPKGTSKKALKLSGKMKVIPMDSPNAPVNAVVQMALTLRIQEVVKRGIKDIMGDYVILGMDPDPQCPCHPILLDAICDLWLAETDDPDEKRAIEDSYGRVKEEFKNWDHR